MAQDERKEFEQLAHEMITAYLKILPDVTYITRPSKAEQEIIQGVCDNFV